MSVLISPVKRLSIDCVIIVLGVFTVIAVTENWQYRSTVDLQKSCPVTKFSWYYLCLSLFCNKETFGKFYLQNTFTVWKVSVFGVILVRIFPHLDLIRRDTPYLSIFSLNVGKYRPELLRILTLFMHCIHHRCLIGS